MSMFLTSAPTESLAKFLNTYNFKQLIQDPTRNCNTSSTCIDLILASYRDRISQCGVIDSSISDHPIIYCSREISKCAIGKHNNVKNRSMENYNKEDFQ